MKDIFNREDSNLALDYFLKKILLGSWGWKGSQGQ